MSEKAVKAPRPIRDPKIWEAVSPLVVMIGLFAVAIITGVSYIPMLILSAIYAGIIAYRCGVTWEVMQKATGKKLEMAMPAMLILICVGMLISSWMFSGTIPAIISVGVKLISAKYILVSTFLLCAVFSICTGTSWGSAGTAGLAMVSIASGMNVNLAAVAGAAYAGAIFGDKLSPLSDTTLLASIIAEQDIFKHIKNMLYTTVPAALIGLVIYFIIGAQYQAATGAGLPENTAAMLASIDEMFNLNIIVIIPILIVLGGALLKKPSLLVMLTSVISAVLIGLFLQGFHFNDGINILVNGFNSNVVVNANPGFDIATVSADATRLLHRGGLMSMMEAVLVTICIYAFAGIVEKAGCLRVAVNLLLGKAKSRVGLVAATIVSGLILAGLGGDTYVSILMTGEMYRQKYIDMGLSTLNLSRTLEDTCTMTIGFFPWTGSGVYYAGVFGVSNLAFLPYAVMCYLCMVVAMVLAATGIGMKKLEDGYQLKTENAEEAMAAANYK